MTVIRPLFALFNRSIREQSRTKFTSVARAAIVLLILLCVFQNERDFANRPAPGLDVLGMLATVNFVAITIFGLGTFSSAITEEKEEETLGLLRMTRLNPLAILLGKSTARLFDGFLLLAVQIPFTMLCVTLGGVAQGQILRTYAILAAYQFFLCNAALLWSVVCRRTGRAAVMKVVTGLTVYVLPIFFIGLLLSRRFNPLASGGQPPSRSSFEGAVQWVLSINPVFDLWKTITPFRALPFAIESIIPSLGLGLLCFCLAWLLFGPCCNTTAEAVPRRPVEAAGDVSSRRLHRSRPGSYAIAWKDFHFLSGGTFAIFIRAAVYAALAGAYFAWIRAITGGWSRSGMSARDVGMVLSTFGIITFGIECGFVGARIFGVERKRKTLGSLVALPLRTSALVWQKVLGFLPVFLPAVILFLIGTYLINRPASNPYGNLGGYGPETIILVLSESVLFAVLVAYFSLRMRRATLAVALTLMFFGHFVMLSAFSGLGRSISAATLVLWMYIVFFAAFIPRRIAAAAAEE